MTMNCPDALFAIHRTSTSGLDARGEVEMAEFIREVGLKCISFNGVC